MVYVATLLLYTMASCIASGPLYSHAALALIEDGINGMPLRENQSGGFVLYFNM